MLTDLALWLRREREARGWARREMARRLIQAGRGIGDTALPDVKGVYQNVRRWERGESKPTERYELYYCAALGIARGQFGLAPAPQPGAEPQAVMRAVPPGPPVAGLPPANTAVRNLVDPRLLASIAVAYRGTYGSDMGRFMVEHEVSMAANEGSDHAEQYEHGAGEATLDQLHADVVRLSRQSDTGEPFAVFLDARRVRARIYRLLDRRPWPREQTDLYLLLGCLSGFMATAANQLGYPDAAEELYRAGFTYANAIGHRPLMARLRCGHSSVAYFAGRFGESRHLALSGLEYLAVGPEGAHLHITRARAAGRLGDADSARQAVREAHEARDRDYTDELVEMGGAYTMSEATHFGLAGAALATIAGAEPEAARELERAIGLYDEGPRGEETYWFAGKPLAGIDLAIVRLRSGALDASVAALQPALSLPVAHRITDMTIKLATARAELAAPIFRGSREAQELAAQIEEFGHETIVAGLHSLPGAPA